MRRTVKTDEIGLKWVKTVETDENKWKQEGGEVGGGCGEGRKGYGQTMQTIEKNVCDDTTTNNILPQTLQLIDWINLGADTEKILIITTISINRQTYKMSQTSQTGLVLKFQGLCLVFYWKYDVLSWILILSKFEWFLKNLGNAGH